MGRKPKYTFVPNEFGTLTKEERRYRGELATILRMRIKGKEKRKRLEEELSNIEKRMDNLIKRIKTNGVEFPQFTIILQKPGSKYPDVKSRYRILYTINKKRVKIDLDTYLKVKQRMDSLYPEGFESFTKEEQIDLIKIVYENDILIKYWENEYEKYLEGKKPKS